MDKSIGNTGFISDGITQFTLFVIAATAIFYWYYDELTEGWQFLGVVLITTIAGLTIGISVFSLSKRRLDKIEKKRSMEMCRILGLSIKSTDPDDVDKCLNYLIARYSPELLVNRLSDFIGIITSIIRSAMGVMISFLYLAMIIYFVWNGDYSSPLLLWIPLSLQVSVALFLFLVSSITNLFFNRLPGEARNFNKSYDEKRLN